MIPNRPYLIRAYYQWIIDNEWTPYIMVDATGDGILAPLEYAEDGRLVLNISPNSVRDLELENDYVNFSARFNGIPTQVQIPTFHIFAIYARENGQGMFFGDIDDVKVSKHHNEDHPPEDPDPKGSGPKGGGKKVKKPNLTVVK